MYITFHPELTSSIKEEEWFFVPKAVLHESIQSAINDYTQEYHLVSDSGQNMKCYSNGYYFFISVMDNNKVIHRIDVMLK